MYHQLFSSPTRFQFVDASLVIFIFWFTIATLRFTIRTVKVTPATSNQNFDLQIHLNNWQFAWKKYHTTHLKTPTSWQLNNPHGLFWQNRTDATFTIQSMRMYVNKYTRGKNSLINTHFKFYENIPRNDRGMKIWNQYDNACKVYVFPPVIKGGEYMTFTFSGLEWLVCDA